MKKALTLCCAALLLAGCSGGPSSAPPPTVVPKAQAQEITPPTIIFPDKPCPTFGQGCVSGEDPGYFLELRVGPAPASKPGIITYKLPYDLDVVRIDGWLGTGYGGRMEVGGKLAYQKPDGHKAAFDLEMDKHVDGDESERQRTWAFNKPLHLPAGTIVTLQVGIGFVAPAPDNPVGCADTFTCGYDAAFKLYSE
jgi:hypothetical protein